MVSGVSLVLILTACCFIGLSHSSKPGVCRVVNSVAVDEEWFDRISSTTGWKLLEASEIQPLNSLPELPSVPVGLKKKRCYSVEIEISQGLVVNIPGITEFDVISEPYGRLDTKDTHLDKSLLFNPQAKIILTDNQKYVFAFTCVNGAYEWWAIFIASGTELDSEAQEKIQEKKTKLGLKESKGENQISIKGFKTAENGCYGVDGKGHGLDLLDLKLKLEALSKNLV